MSEESINWKGRGRPARIAVIHPSRGQITPENWSGTPYGLVTAMSALGVDVTEVGYGTHPLLRRSAHVLARVAAHDLTAAEHSSVKMTLRQLSFQRQLDQLGEIDGILALGTDCYRLDALRTRVPIVTYDDATLATMWAHPDSDTSKAGFRRQDVERWIATQRASTQAARFCCVSTAWAARAVSSDYAIPMDRVVVVGMGHRPRGESYGGQRDWSVPCFLFVGVDWTRKNGERVLRAFARVRERRPEATLHLVGRHARIDQPGVIDHGLLARDDPNAQAELDELLRMATAFVLPSRFDPSPIAYLEAASAGLPVVATTEGGAGELLGEAAITVAPSDDEAIYRAMLTLADAKEARRRGALARAVAGEATWQHVAMRILACLADDAMEKVEVDR